MTTLTESEYACVAGEPNIGGARCQAAAATNLRCEKHQDESLYPKATQPSNLWVEFFIKTSDIPENIREALEVQRRTPSDDREARKVAWAESIGRDAHVYGKNMNASGSEVWCGNGVENVSASRLLIELYSEGYCLWDVVYYNQGNEKRCTVRVKLSTHFLREDFSREYIKRRAWINALFASEWEKAKVFCNPSDGEHGIRHIVQLRRQSKNNPSRFLTLKDWMWGITSEAI